MPESEDTILHNILLPCALLSIAGYAFMLATLVGFKALRTRSNFILSQLALSGLVNQSTYCFYTPRRASDCIAQVSAETGVAHGD
jgi:hypothetical protein